MEKRVLNYLNTSRFLIIGLIVSQLLTICYINYLFETKKESELNKRICMEELIPLETIPMEELR